MEPKPFDEKKTLVKEKVKDFCRKFRLAPNGTGSCVDTCAKICPLHCSQNPQDRTQYRCSDRFVDQNTDEVERIIKDDGYPGLEDEELTLLIARVKKYCDWFYNSTTYGGCKASCPFAGVTNNDAPESRFKCVPDYIRTHREEIRTILEQNKA